MKSTKEMKAEIKKISSVEELKEYLADMYSNKEEYGISTKTEATMILIWLLQDEIKELERSL